jgi:uncharacterized membrane protein YraQ (UPF0718 family)
MLALGLAILILTIGPLPPIDLSSLDRVDPRLAPVLSPLLPNLLLAVGVALLAGALLWAAQTSVDSIIFFLKRERSIAIALSAFLGLVNPMCDCGIIVVMRRLLRKGLPLSCCVAYILAGPIINVLVMATTYQAFSGLQNDPNVGRRVGFAMMGLRMSFGYVVAVVTALIVERQFRRHGAKLLAPGLEMPSGLPVVENDDLPAEKRSLKKSLANISETALHDFVDVMVYLVMGALLAGCVRQFLNPAVIESGSKDNAGLAIGLMMGLAFLITLCSETDAFVVAGFTLAPSAKLAFLVFGPMFDMKLFFMYTRVFRPRLMWTIVGSIAVQIFLYCFLYHLLWLHYGSLFWPGPASPGSPG